MVVEEEEEDALGLNPVGLASSMASRSESGRRQATSDPSRASSSLWPTRELCSRKLEEGEATGEQLGAR